MHGSPCIGPWANNGHETKGIATMNTHKPLNFRDNRGEARSNDWYQRPVDLGVLDNEYRKTARQRRLVHKFRVRSEQQRIATLADARASR